jgi:hypothetical protein
LTSVLLVLLLELTGCAEFHFFAVVDSLYVINCSRLPELSDHAFRRTHFVRTPKKPTAEFCRGLEQIKQLSEALVEADRASEHLRTWLNAACAADGIIELESSCSVYRRLAESHLDCLEAPLNRRGDAMVFIIAGLATKELYNSDEAALDAVVALLQDLFERYQTEDFLHQATATFILSPAIFAVGSWTTATAEKRAEILSSVLKQLNMPPCLDLKFFPTPSRLELHPTFSLFLEIIDNARSTSAFQRNSFLGQPFVDFLQAERRLAVVEKEALAAILDVVLLKAEQQRWAEKKREEVEMEERDRL